MHTHLHIDTLFKPVTVCSKGLPDWRKETMIFCLPLPSAETHAGKSKHLLIVALKRWRCSACVYVVERAISCLGMNKADLGRVQSLDLFRGPPISVGRNVNSDCDTDVKELTVIDCICEIWLFNFLCCSCQWLKTRRRSDKSVQGLTTANETLRGKGGDTVDSKQKPYPPPRSSDFC